VEFLQEACGLAPLSRQASSNFENELKQAYKDLKTSLIIGEGTLA
jgi:hypothetical protein